ncbi:hypothetical protein D1007_44523 [Hordeum vulgare]|nr:hypothetical protein D1007_44523 [Hordeum vulgare]
MRDTEMAKLFGITVNDRDKDKGEFSLPANVDEDVDGQLMKEVADDVDDAHDDELLPVYDKENPVIEVGKFWPNMYEFRMCFKTYVVKHEFEAKTVWTDRRKFYARCIGFDGSVKPCKWYHVLHRNLMEVLSRLTKSPINILVLQFQGEYQPSHHNFGL